MTSAPLTVAAATLRLAATRTSAADGRGEAFTAHDSDVLLPAHMRYDRVGPGATYVAPDDAAAELIDRGYAAGTPASWHLVTDVEEVRHG